MLPEVCLMAYIDSNVQLKIEEALVDSLICCVIVLSCALHESS